MSTEGNAHWERGKICVSVQDIQYKESYYKYCQTLLIQTIHCTYMGALFSRHTSWLHPNPACRDRHPWPGTSCAACTHWCLRIWIPFSPDLTHRSLEAHWEVLWSQGLFKINYYFIFVSLYLDCVILRFSVSQNWHTLLDFGFKFYLNSRNWLWAPVLQCTEH